MPPVKKEHPYCFGKLDNVFPLAKDGLRHTPESCMVIKVEEERVKRAYGSGTIGFIERWSRKKALTRQKRYGDKK
jgi:hypothetical protein